jgi:hypothetical protein
VTVELPRVEWTRPEFSRIDRAWMATVLVPSGMHVLCVVCDERIVMGRERASARKVVKWWRLQVEGGDGVRVELGRHATLRAAKEAGAAWVLGQRATRAMLDELAGVT